MLKHYVCVCVCVSVYVCVYAQALCSMCVYMLKQYALCLCVCVHDQALCSVCVYMLKQYAQAQQAFSEIPESHLMQQHQGCNPCHSSHSLGFRERSCMIGPAFHVVTYDPVSPPLVYAHEESTLVHCLPEFRKSDINFQATWRLLVLSTSLDRAAALIVNQRQALA